MLQMIQMLHMFEMLQLLHMVELQLQKNMKINEGLGKSQKILEKI